MGEVEELSGEEHLLRDEQGGSCAAQFIAQHIPKFSSDPSFLDTMLHMAGECLHVWSGHYPKSDRCRSSVRISLLGRRCNPE